MNLLTPVAQGNLSNDRRPVARMRRRSRGFTLIEMLVSLAITLVMMGAVVTLFAVVSESVASSRTAIEMSDRLRAARDQLQRDLIGATATMNPPLRPEMDEGYFEIIEGRSYDDYPRYYAANNSIKSSVVSGPVVPPGSWTLFGDTDDVLMFTVRSRGAPFLGRLTSSTNAVTTIESPVAEVVYFLVQDGPQIDASVVDSASNPLPTRLCTLYRRVLLVSPTVGNITSTTTLPQYNTTFHTDNDLSVHYQLIGTANTLVPNTLGDLTKRENRFAHYGTTAPASFPYLVDTTICPQVPFAVVTQPTVPGGFVPPSDNAFLAPFNGVRLGDDVLLTNVVAFDVRVWDPDAPMRVDGSGFALEPGDPKWSSAGTNSALGAYVDLGYNHSTTPGTRPTDFSRINANAFHSGMPYPVNASHNRIYDTWSLHYENDGVQQRGAVADGGTNGLDDNSNGLVDENPYKVLVNGTDENGNGTDGDPAEYHGEYDTLPPYAAPLRGIRVTIRVYEPNSKQIREAVVIQNFDSK